MEKLRGAFAMNLKDFETLTTRNLNAENKDGLSENRKIFSVHDITRIIKNTIEKDPILGNVYVKGEVSNFTFHSSGHMYFVLKSASATLKCVSFKHQNRKFKFKPGNGMKIVAGGNIGVYAMRGEYQLYVENMSSLGTGSLHEQFELLKLELAKEGLFEDIHKRELPVYPERIGIITGTNTAAYADIVNTLQRRYPCAELVVAPATVQGMQAEMSIIDSLALMNCKKDIDVIILGRGGGSLEDLWAFNLENVVRAVFNSKIPIITGIGHQTDFTLCDFVADMRAPTPTGAAELVAPDLGKLRESVKELENRIKISMAGFMERASLRTNRLSDNIFLKEPQRLLSQPRQTLDGLYGRLEREIYNIQQHNQKSLDERIAVLNSLSPSRILERGYSIVLTEGGQIIRHANEIELDDMVNIRFSSSEISARVTRRRNEN